MEKHAYLIVAHKTDLCLSTLLELIDDERNDIFIHMDKKNKKYSESWAKRYVSKSNLYHTNRISVNWGAYSLVRAEIMLLEAATRTDHYEYYHILSGDDLPLKTQDYIHEKLHKTPSIEYIGFASNTAEINARVKRYHFFREQIGRKNGFIQKILRRVDCFAELAQSKFEIVRNEGIVFGEGANWISVTDDFARYVISKEEWIKKHFHHTLIPDEEFIQTLAINSRFANKVYLRNEYQANLRYIDWLRGGPYVFRSCDFEQLKASDRLFARKFDEEIDSNIILQIKSFLQKQ